MQRLLLVAVLVLGTGLFVFADKKKKDEVTQVLALPKEPPAVAIGETSRLTFQVSPLSEKGLLSAQARDAIKAILKINGGVPIVHLRAFVAGSGDMRRVPQIVSEVLTDKKMELPSVSVVQTGGLGMVNAQVVLEAVSIAKKDMNRDGLRFVPGQVFSSTGALSKSVDALSAGMAGSTPLSVSCFVSELTPDTAASVSRKFPGAAINVVQTQRAPLLAVASCEGVARGGPVTAPKLAFSGTQIAFGFEEKDAALAFQRFDQQLKQAGTNPAGIVLQNLYPVSQKIAATAHKLRPSLSDASVPFEGLASVDGSFAVDAVAAVLNQ